MARGVNQRTSRQDQAARTPPRQQQPQQPAPDYDSFDDDIPFD